MSNNNGYANYQTESILLWLGNDEYLYNRAMSWLRTGRARGLSWITAAALPGLCIGAFGMADATGNFRRQGIKCKKGQTPDGVELTDPAIDWQEIADDLSTWEL